MYALCVSCDRELPESECTQFLVPVRISGTDETETESYHICHACEEANRAEGEQMAWEHGW